METLKKENTMKSNKEKKSYSKPVLTTVDLVGEGILNPCSSTGHNISSSGCAQTGGSCSTSNGSH